MSSTLSLVWDLESIFPGGVDGPAFQAALAEVENLTSELAREIEGWSPGQSADRERTGGAILPESLAAVVLKLQEIQKRGHELGAFTSCATAQDVADESAQAARAKVRDLGARVEALWSRVDEAFLAMEEPAWEEFLSQPGVREIAFALGERRELARKAMPPRQEALASDLAVDGFHAWGEMYHRIAGKLRVEVERDGEVRSLSVAQAQNEMLYHPERDIRRDVFAKYEAAWAGAADLLAACLNHIGGFRLALYRHRGWEEILTEPLTYNRMRRETLEAMWEAASQGAERAAAFIQRKAGVLGLSDPAYYDVDAPLGAAKSSLSFAEAAELIVDTFHTLSPEMAHLAHKAFAGRWIEAEDRPGKRAGGFCTSFPVKGESRIFMTYDQSLGSVATLAHELGHAFHHAMVSKLPYLMTGYPMSLAETASTLAEKIVTDARKKATADPEERLAIVNEGARRAVTFLMNIRARFEFERAFYQERRHGHLSPARLSELMLEAQKEAYRGALSVYHPLLWASKLHFYLTSVPFYNFPYTFGYLFSHGVLEWAKAEGKNFEERYMRLLRDTGAMPVEELAKRHLGVDLKKPEFWRRAVALALEDIEEFLALTGPQETGSPGAGA